MRGFSPLIFVLSIGAILFFLAFFGGTIYRYFTQTESAPAMVSESTASAVPTSSASATLKPTLKPSSSAVPQSPYPKTSLPSDIPLFAGAEIIEAWGGRIKSCGYQETNKFCEVNSFIYHIKKPGLSVEEVKNWYVTNPNPAWVFGTPTFTEGYSGRIVKGDTYFIIRIAGFGENQGVQLTFEGPYENK